MPTVAGMVRKVTIESAWRTVARRPFMSASAARRARPLVATVPTATPKRPIGRYRIRNAYSSQDTAPGSWEAKMLFTKMLTCTAARPTVAGPMSEPMRRMPGSPGAHSGTNRHPLSRRGGTWTANWAIPPSSVPTAQPITTWPASKPIAHNPTPHSMATTLNMEEASAGGPKRSSAFSMPMATAERFGPPAQERDHDARSEEHTSELQSLTNLVSRLLLEKKKRPDLPDDPHLLEER